MAQEEKERKRSEKEKRIPITIDSISSGQDEIDIDNIRLIDYGGKDDEMFKDLSIDEPESIDALDMTKIYENELEQSDDELELGEEEMKRIRGFEESIKDKTKRRAGFLGNFYPGIDTAYNSKVPDLNSDVDNDICRENIKKIYNYLNEDQNKEKEIREEIAKTLEYIEKTKGEYNPSDS